MYRSQRPLFRPSAPGFGAPRSSTAAATLLGQVLGITGVGFLITAIGAYLGLPLPHGAALIALFAGFGVLIAINRTQANPSLALTLFYVFTLLEGIGIAPTVGHYLSRFGPGIVIDAASTTGLGMLVLGAVAMLGGIDWRRFSGVAFGALLALVIVGLVSSFTHFLHPGTYAWFSLGIFSVLVLIDFSRIRAGGDGLGPVQLATSIYLDGINIFLALLEIFGMRRRDD